MKNIYKIKLLFIGTILGIFGTLFVINFNQIIGVEIIRFGKIIHKVENTYEPYEDLSFNPFLMDTTELIMYMNELESLTLKLDNSYKYFVDNTKNSKYIPDYRLEYLRIKKRIIHGHDRFLCIYNIIKINKWTEKINDIK